MILKNLICKKVYATLLSVCFAVTLFANNGGVSFYIKKGTIVSGLSYVHATVAVVKNTKNIVATVKINFTKKNVLPAKKQEPKKNHTAQIKFKPYGKTPFRGGFLEFYKVNVAFVISNTTKHSKATKFSKTKKQINLSVVKLAFCQLHKTFTTYNAATTAYTSCVLSINYCRPPPIV